jgi:predicted AlkP superfamily pyrophosphatase or phosphodiesterase
MARRILCLLSLFFTLNPLSFPLHAGGLRSLRRVNGSVVETNAYQPGKRDGQPRRVVIIDIDGLPNGGTLFYFRTLPNFRRIIGQYTKTGFERAVYFRKATTIFPSVTLPGHASIFTGTYPGRHGIVGNEWFDRRSGRLINYMSLGGST